VSESMEGFMLVLAVGAAWWYAFRRVRREAYGAHYTRRAGRDLWRLLAFANVMPHSPWIPIVGVVVPAAVASRRALFDERARAGGCPSDHSASVPGVPDVAARGQRVVATFVLCV